MSGLINSLTFVLVLLGCACPSLGLNVSVIQAITQTLIDQFVPSLLPVGADAFLPTDKIIKKYGYPVETHNIQTSDGYILKTFRIPHGRRQLPGLLGNTREPVLIMHPFLGSSVDYLLQAYNVKGTLPFMYADAGFDVWLANLRGNKYSLNNTNFSFTDNRFWNFSINEQVNIDIPTTIDYILKETKQKQILYFGFSLGAASIFSTLSVLPEYNNKIRRITAVAPASFSGNSRSPLFGGGLLNGIPDSDFLTFFDTFFRGAFVTDQALQPALPFICASRPTLCYLVLFLAGEFNPGQVNLRTLTTVAGQFPDLTSARLVLNRMQRTRSKNFSAFDYGEEGNLAEYGTPYPLQYDLRKTTVPVCGLYGPKDLVNVPEDALKTYNMLPRWCNRGNGAINNLLWRHFDNLIARDAGKLVYSRSISFFQQKDSDCSC